MEQLEQVFAGFPLPDELKIPEINQGLAQAVLVAAVALGRRNSDYQRYVWKRRRIAIIGAVLALEYFYPNGDDDDDEERLPRQIIRSPETWEQRQVRANMTLDSLNALPQGL